MRIAGLKVSQVAERRHWKRKSADLPIESLDGWEKCKMMCKMELMGILKGIKQ
jgi:hypothetical protein